MARLPDDFQLLALALLSMADDWGYFHADPAIVRGSVMPFRENLARISDGLAKLSEVDWIQLWEHPEQGKIGRITNWEKHQKVDHPRDSQLSCYTSRETLAKLSREPRAGMEGNGKGKEEDSPLQPPVGPKEPGFQLNADPEDHRDHYHRDSRTALHYLNEKTGARFREVDSNLSLISERLRESEVTIEGVMKMVDRQVQLWKGTKMEQYLRPETLFGKKKFDGYYALRDNAVTPDSNQPGAFVNSDGLVCGPDTHVRARL